MDELDGLARLIRDAYGLSNLGAARLLVEEYVAMCDPGDNTADPQEVAALVQAATRQPGTPRQPAHQPRLLLQHPHGDALLHAIRSASTAWTEARAVRDALIEFAMHTTLNRDHVANAADLSRPRVYQIKEAGR